MRRFDLGAFASVKQQALQWEVVDDVSITAIPHFGERGGVRSGKESHEAD